MSDFKGTRLLLGGDVRLTRTRWLLSAEALYARLNPAGAGATTHPLGFHVTMGYKLTDQAQLLLRWDDFEADGLADDVRTITVGYNHWLTPFAKLQLNYIVDPEESGFEHHQILLLSQVGF